MTAEFGRSPDGLFRVRSDDGTVGEARESVFPIFIREGPNALRAVGTGFYIAGCGLFATAAHVLDESLDSQGNIVKGMQLLHRNGDKVHWRPVIQTTTHFLADVAIGIAAPMVHNTTGESLQNKYLSLSSTIPFPTEPIATFAFPETEVTEEPPSIDMHSGWYSGRLMEYLPRGRDKTLPGACYRTTMALHGGASGGPVFDSRGKVFGVNSTGFQDDYISYVSCISSILELHIEGVLHLETKQLTNFHVQELVERKIVIFE